MANLPLPPPSAALSRRLEAVATRYLIDRYSGPGNPMKSQTLRLGSVIATKVPFVPGHAAMNAVHGLEDVADLPQVLAFYAETNQPCWIELPPDVDPNVASALIASGFKPASKKAVLYGPATPDPTTNPAVELTFVPPADLDLFLDTLNEGFDTPTAMLPAVRRNQSFWSDVAHWRLYLAKLDGQVAGAAVLAITDNLGYLAAGSTLSSFRERGVHAAMIARRLADAAAASCAFVVGQAAFESSSHRNQERAGLKLAHIREDWTNA